MNAAEPTFWRRLRTTRLRDAVRGRFDGRLDWRHVIASADLPAEVADVVEQVVRRTRLWRSEKVDVTQELIAHFQDGLDAGRTPEQLVESFGDGAQAARLIRRAKKRGRSLVWQVWRWACWSAAGLFVFYVASILYLMMGRPTVSTDYLAIVNERALAVPEDERAWPLYRAAINQIQINHKFPEWNDQPAMSPGDADWSRAIDWLTAHEGALQTIRDAAKQPEMGFPVWTGIRSFPKEDRETLFTAKVIEQSAPPSDNPLMENTLIATHVPQLAAMRSMTRLLSIDARRAALAGDGQTAYADVVAMLRMSPHCEEQPFLVSGVVAAAVQKLAVGAIGNVMSENAALWSDDQLQDLAHLVASSKVDWHRSFQGERLLIYDIVQRMYTDDGEGDGRITLEGLRNMRPLIGLLDADQLPDVGTWEGELRAFAYGVAIPATPYVMASRAELVEKYESLMNQQEATLEGNLWEIDPDAVIEEVNHWSGLERARYLPIPTLFPSLGLLRKTIGEGCGLRDGVLVGIALELYHREHDDWPPTLDELAPKYLPQVPIDRITGEPLHYKVVDDRPVVYSVGADRDDDAGRAAISSEGETDRELAGPRHMHDAPEEQPDGDWVIWSAVRDEEPGAGSQ